MYTELITTLGRRKWKERAKLEFKNIIKPDNHTSHTNQTRVMTHNQIQLHQFVASKSLVCFSLAGPVTTDNKGNHVFTSERKGNRRRDSETVTAVLILNP